MKTLTLPKWTRQMPDDAYITTKEVSDIFGCTTSNINYLISKGFPSADKSKVGVTNKSMWKLSTLRKFEKEQDNG